MATRDGVVRLVGMLPDAVEHHDPDGGISWTGGRHVFVRLAPPPQGHARLWSGDMGSAPALDARPRVFPVVTSYRFRVAFDVALGRIGTREFAELLLDSYAIRTGTRRAAAVDLEMFFDAVEPRRP